MSEHKKPFQIFDPNKAYRISDFARRPQSHDSGKIPMAKSAIWKAVKEGDFPPPTKLGSRTSVWFGDDLNRWLEEKFHQSNNAA